MIADIFLTYRNFQCTWDLSPTIGSTPLTVSTAQRASYYWAGQTKRGTTKGAVPLALRLLDGLKSHIL